MTRNAELRTKVARIAVNMLTWGRHRVPPGVRTLIGVLLMVGGMLGFLPVLGFWMFPLGLAFVALDFPLGRRWLDRWLDRRRTAAGE